MLNRPCRRSSRDSTEGGDAGADPRVTAGVLHLAAYAHGEWIRIRPFGNGNGRTARLWTAWVCARYGLPLLVAGKPRPADPDNAVAAFDSMDGQHGRMALYLARRLVDVVSRQS